MFNKLACAAVATELLFCTTGRAATLQVGPALIEATPTFFINNVRHDADFGFNTLARAITDAIIENETRVRTAS
jgi:hypothetical protein